MNKTYEIQIKSDRFDQKSDLPDDANAGNKFYGKDLAEYLKENLSLTNYDIIDEDWGWLLFGKYNDLEINYGISDWHNADNIFGGNKSEVNKTEANWGIFITAYQKNKLLGLIPYNKEVDCPNVIIQNLIQLMKTHGDTIISHGLT
jgi:hypothetical protein